MWQRWKKYRTGIEDKIQNLQDYKISMIADVVVGKIDVRDIEIPEYEFVSEDSGDRISDGEIEYREEWEDWLWNVQIQKNPGWKLI